MAKVKFNVLCMAQYSSELELPEDLDIKNKEDLLGFIRDNLSNAPIKSTLKWVSDIDDLNSAVSEYDLFEIIRDNGSVESL